MEDKVETANDNTISQALESQAPAQMVELALQPVPGLCQTLANAPNSPGLKSDLRRCEEALAKARQKGLRL
jgi:hypothetical protein